MAKTSDFSPGGDAKAIRDVASDVYGGYRQMFDAHQWAAPGDKMMVSAPSLIVERYGSIRAFVIAHQDGVRIDQRVKNGLWDQGYSVLLTSFWGWSPETWGTVGWTGDRGRTRRNNLLLELSDPFITVCYVTRNKTRTDPKLKGMVAGFYLVSHETGDKDQFTHPIYHGQDGDSWGHSLKAVRAFSYLPEHRLRITDLDPAISSRARSVSAMGEVITDPRQLQLLRDTPWTEVEVYGSSARAPAGPAGPDQGRGWVQAGPANTDGYVVADGSQWTPRELYILKLTGNIDAYLGYPAQGRSIVKVGLSASPDLRRQTFQKAMPRGSFEWKTFRTTRTFGLEQYPSHAIAVNGEDAMKRHLASCADVEWLTGEFYLASDRDIETAWRLGCEAARA